MIRASGKSGKDGRPVLIIGLSRRNCERLLEGDPIPFDAAPWGVDAHIVVVAGENEAAITQSFRDHGVQIRSGGPN
jgi:hypothetical protein